MTDPIMLAYYSMLTLRIFRIEHLASVYIEAYGLDHERVPAAESLISAFHKFNAWKHNAEPLTTQHFVLYKPEHELTTSPD
jgi:hypothetical protein